jgi:hypothetical protein
MAKGKNKGPKIPVKQLNQQQQKKVAMEKIVLQRKAESQERVKMIYKGIMDGIAEAFKKMEDGSMGEPTFNEMNDAIYRAGHSYNERAMEEQWKNVQIVDPKNN